MAVNLVIIVEGGMVQEIVSDNPSAFENIAVTTIDYDVGDEPPSLVPQEDGSMRGAGWEKWPVGQLVLDLETIQANDGVTEYWSSMYRDLN